ncbi:MAG: hypothetical protein ACU0BF_06470 [Paracoccaceae bacterium]
MRMISRPLIQATALAFGLASCAPTGGGFGTASGGDGGDVRQFAARLERDPTDPEARRGLARAYADAGRLNDARGVYLDLSRSGGATAADRLALVEVALNLDDVATATAALGAVPVAQGGARRAMLDAMVADRGGDWARADAGYAAAASGADAARALNNWGVSRLARGDVSGAQSAFARAVAADASLFVAHNNLAIARAMAGDYAPPGGGLAAAQRAVLLHNMGLMAERRGDLAAARELLREAIRLHPRDYGLARARLASLG